jgi:8-oxo-dGTP pyrophosphatase MutT (NUDIX family)
MLNYKPSYFVPGGGIPQKIVCTNCGIEGHVYRLCTAPITSYGVIAVRNLSTTINQSVFCSTNETITGTDNGGSQLEFLLICRKDTLSFVEFIRGKYNIAEETYLGNLFKGMTLAEHVKLLTMSFDDLWKSVWGETSKNHKGDYELSEKKFGLLSPRLAELLGKYKTTWTEPEWGFPKGRRNPHESDIACAIREFHEETGIDRDYIDIIQNMNPLEENFMGSNRVHYCHKYYIANCYATGELEVQKDNPHMAREIGNLQWFTLDEALSKIRPDNIEKREILLAVGRLMRNFCPVSSD